MGVGGDAARRAILIAIKTRHLLTVILGNIGTKINLVWDMACEQGRTEIAQ